MNVELARRAVASKHWRWMPGMKAVSTNHYYRPARVESLEGETYGLTVIPDSDGPVFASHHEYGIAGQFPRGCTVPDLTDPATLGCLLHLVRDAWGDNLMVTGWRNTQTSSTNRAPRPAWRVSPGALAIFPGTPMHTMSTTQHRTEAEALVAALEAAP